MIEKKNTSAEKKITSKRLTAAENGGNELNDPFRWINRKKLREGERKKKIESKYKWRFFLSRTVECL